MNNKAFTISIALALMAVFMIYSYISSKEEEVKAVYGTKTSVVVAKRDITEMSEIYDNMVELSDKPQKFIEPGTTKTVAEVRGKIASVNIRKGEQITLNKIIEPGVKTGLSRQVSVGKRAIAIPVDDFNAVNRLMKPGDRIDLMATIDPPGGAKGSQITKLILQDVPILAVGEFITSHAPRKAEYDPTTGKEVTRNLNSDRNFNTITVEVDAQAALQITLIKDTGARLGVLLRNNDDTERLSVPGTTLTDVLGADAARIIRVPAAAGPR